MNVTDEILIDDSDDDFVPTTPEVDGRRRSSTRKRNSVERLGVGQKHRSGSKPSSTPSAGHIEDEFANSRGSSRAASVKKTDIILTEDRVKDIFKSALKEKLSATVSTHKNNGNFNTPPVKKLSEGWKQAQAKLNLLSKSDRKSFTIDDDFKDKPSKTKFSRTPIGSGAKVVKPSRSFNKSTLSESVLSSRSEESVISLDDEEDELEAEFAKIDQLKLSLDKQVSKSQSMKPINKTPSLRKSSVISTSTPVKINFIVKKSSVFDSRLQKVTQGNKHKTLKKEKVAYVPKVVETGPIDIFDDLIIKTTQGHPCNFCDKNLIFIKRREMINHLQLEHEEELTTPQKDRELAGVFICDTCDASFHSKHILRTHTKAHKKVSAIGKCDNYYNYYLNIKVY